MKKKNTLQLISLFVFGIAGVVGLIMFSTTKNFGGGSEAPIATGQVTIWGTLPSEVFSASLGALSESNEGLSVRYVEKNPDTFETELLEALAIDAGPDLFVMSDRTIVKHVNKVFVIPYASYTRTRFETTFIDQAEMFLSNEGIIAFPFLVDPMVMYYNKYILASEFLIEPPKYWNELFQFTERVTKGASSGITQSAVAMGTFDNIEHAKDIIAMMVLQTGNPIVVDPFGRPESVLIRSTVAGVPNTTAEVLDFYTSFSNSRASNYSWNTSLRNSKEAFASEDLAVYFGFASEVDDFGEMNPNLNFDVELVPQHEGAKNQVTLGHMYALAISKDTKNLPAAYTVAATLSSAVYAPFIASEFRVPSILRSQLQTTESDEVYEERFKQSAIIARGWYDIDERATNDIFRELIRSINSGVRTTSSALSKAQNDISNIRRR